MPFNLKATIGSKISRSRSPLPTAARNLIPSADQPGQPIIGPASIGTGAPNPPSAIGKGQNYGVKVLFDGGNKPRVDIVFVHGLTGNAYNTWHHEETEIHWPSAFLRQDIPDARILSYGYDADIVNLWNPASVSRLSNHAENMVGDLVRHRERTDTESRKILFVAHSLGGLVTEHALSYSRKAAEKHLHQVEHCTAGIAFLGVPHCGADLASWASFGTRMVSILKATNSEIVKVLEPGSEMLHLVENDFHSILRQRKDEGSEISITCFYEELRVTAVGEIVPLHSAQIAGYSCYGIHANHMQMTKFSSREDPGYDRIVGELQRWAKSTQLLPLQVTRPPEAKATDCLEPALNKNDTEMGLDDQSSASVNEHDHYGNGSVIHGSISRLKHGDRATFSSESADRKANSLWMVPRNSNSLYIGRGELTELIEKSFSIDPLSPPKQQQIFVITGLGGTGKSEVCLKFAENHRAEYWGVFWIDAASVATADQGYSAIAHQCGLTETSAEHIKSWLACKSERWLLIVDNADDRNIDYADILPHSNKGDVLITTRIRECCIYNTVGYKELQVLEPELAGRLLLRAAGVQSSRWEAEEKAATAIIHILGSHTLAIIQAGAFVRQKRCTLEEYPDVFEEHQKQLLNFYSMRNTSTYRNVYATFEVSATYLQTSGSSEDSDALDFLHTLAFMNNNGVSESIFRMASEYAYDLENGEPSKGRSNGDEVLSMSACHIARLPRYCHPQQPSDKHHMRWRQLSSILESLSLITISEYGGVMTISAHPLVFTWAKERQDDQIRCTAWQSAATILALSCQGCYDYSPAFRFLQSHVRACISHEIEKYTQNLPDEEAAQLLFQLMFVLWRLRDDAILYSCLSRVRSRLQNIDRMNQGTRLRMQNLIGVVAYQQQKYAEAINVFEENYKDRARTLPKDWQPWLDLQHNLGAAYLENGQVDEALDLLKRVVECKEKMEEDCPDRLISQHELAHAYMRTGQDDKAIDLLEHVVRVREKMVEDHPERLTSQHLLARLYLKRRQVDKAVVLLQHVVKVREHLAEDHPTRLSSQYQLARAYLLSGQVDNAVDLLECVVKVRKKLAEDHPDRLKTQHLLAYAYERRNLPGNEINQGMMIKELSDDL